MEAPTSSVTVTFPQFLRRRNPIPDVPEDVDYVMQHLNDPNWDLDRASPRASIDSLELDDKSGVITSSRLSIRSSNGDSDSQVDSSYRTSSGKGFDVEEYDDESPYAEVRAAVANTDDPSMPVNTFRTWFIGIVLAMVLAIFNHFFGTRYPSVAISALVMQLVALPCGKAFEYLLPTTRFTTFGYTWSLNPGPFNIKEHTLITVMSNSIYGDVYVSSVFVTQQAFYHQALSIGYQLTLSLSTQLIGYSFVGFLRNFLVWPSSMIWPGSLVSCALLRTLHKSYGKKEGRHMSRERFFLYVMIAATVWYFFPGFVFTALSMFNWVCWIAPENPTVNALFGYASGLGMGFLTFDWAMISFMGSPLVTPWWAELNIWVGFVICYWVIAPIMYFKNALYAKYMPISAGVSYDNTGMTYVVDAILTNGVFDLEKYKAYSPLYMPTTLSLAYGVQFAAFTAVIVHVLLWYRRDIFRQFNRSLGDERDVHARLMSVYPEVPWYWYATVGVVALVLGAVGIEVYDTGMPLFGLLVALIVAAVFVIPIGIIRAVTNQMIPLNVLSELIGGYIIPGRPIAVMLFKTYGFNSVNQALSFTADQKIGHYMKIPPRSMFMAQVIPTIMSAMACIGVQYWQFAHIEDLCSPTQKDGYVCPGFSTFATASVIWGGIGPKRIFSAGALYHPMLYFLIVGAVLPIPFYFLAYRYPHSFWRYVNIPVIFAGLGVMPPATGVNFSAWITVGCFFMWFMRRYHFFWWMRYNYILSAALDAGLALGLILIFFCLQLPKNGITLNWWGNTVWTKTFDALGMPFYSLPPNATFGPQTWV
ncbi:OPT oligopeptide transporter [Sparassis latifolia]|uniref:Glutathione transporter 1 n=1 Tax=Sparassis crispa TaxID=139825 RepID=A0A401G8B0_9APHY|nr:Glutathione transporter 1 [Sparassis crispa]GBE78430.1 Glutathione transporter 1 [Sparassis crispa]